MAALWIMKNTEREKMRELFKKDLTVVMAITGGGAGAIQSLTERGGASAILLEATVPYSKKSSDIYTGVTPAHYCSREQALNLAVSSYTRGKEQVLDKNCIGLGATARLTTNYDGKERKGRTHEIWVATHTDNVTRTFHCEFRHDRTRQFEEMMCSEIIMEALFDAACIDYNRIVLRDEDEPLVKMIQSSLGYEQVYLKGDTIVAQKDNKMLPIRHDDHIVFPGSFNPLHEGHIAMAEAVYKKTRRTVFFEICVKNSDKPLVDYMRLRERIEQIESVLSNNPMYAGYIVSNNTLFVQKAQRSGFKHYMLGMDTFNRLFSNKYDVLYDTGTDKYSLTKKEEIFKQEGMHFWVSNRAGVENRTGYTHDSNLWTFIKDEEYTDTGISSTQLRINNK